MKYVWNMKKSTLIFDILIQPLPILDFAPCFYVLIDIFFQSSYNFETFLSTTGTTVPCFLRPCYTDQIPLYHTLTRSQYNLYWSDPSISLLWTVRSHFILNLQIPCLHPLLWFSSQLHWPDLSLFPNWLDPSLTYLPPVVKFPLTSSGLSVKYIGTN